jgi:hypothetical protein
MQDRKVCATPYSIFQPTGMPEHTLGEYVQNSKPLVYDGTSLPLSGDQLPTATPLSCIVAHQERGLLTDR